MHHLAYKAILILMKQSITIRYLITVMIRILQYPFVSVCACVYVNIFPVNNANLSIFSSVISCTICYVPVCMYLCV